MRITTSTEINAPAATVWACIDEPDNILRWVEGAVEHRYITPRENGHEVGQRFVQKLMQGPSVREFEGALIAFEPYEHFAFRIPAPAYSSEAHFRLTPLGPSKTRIDYAIDITLHTAKAKAIAALLRLPLTFFIPKQMRRLKRLAESLTEGAR